MFSHTQYFRGAINLAEEQSGHEQKYALQMALQGKGHALFDPYPGQHMDETGELVRNPCVEIGDVGYVSQGSFHLLFNIHREKTDAMQINGVPEGFVTLERRGQSIDYRSRPCPRSMHSSRKVAVDLGAGGTVPGVASSSLSWTFSQERGASLAYFDRHEVWDAQDKARYERYFRQHYKSWLVFVGFLDLKLTLRDIVLVTGCDRTRAWATLWSETSSASGSVQLEVQTAIGASVQLTGSVEWKHVAGIPSLSGPPAEELQSETQPLPETDGREGVAEASSTSNESETRLSVVSKGQSKESVAPVRADQCIFIRGYRGKEMFPATAFRLRGGGPPRIHVASVGGSGPGKKGRHGRSGGRRSTGRTELPETPGPSGERNEQIEELAETEQVTEEVLGTSPNEAISLLSITLDLVAARYRPTCKRDILLMHDDDLVKYLPEPGLVARSVWENAEHARLHMGSVVNANPPDSLTKIKQSWVQRGAKVN